jgi:methanogenic corrinoid protein MtbC1
MMRRLISTGVAPCDAAATAKAHKVSIPVENIIEDFTVREDVVNSLHRASKSLDKNFVETLLRKDITDNGVIGSWTEVIVPLLFLVGDEWAATGTGIEVEHMLSAIIKMLLSEGVTDINEPINAHPVLLASVGEELHCLALHALAAALAEKGIESFFLGARTPLEAISGMVKRSAPPAVFLWAQLEQNSDPKFFNELPVVRPAPRIIVGGPGWDRETCIDVVVAQDLTHACDEIERAVGL